LFHVRE